MSNEDLENKFEKNFILYLKKYKKILITFLIILISLPSILFFLEHKSEKQNKKISEKFYQANFHASDKKFDEAKKLLIEVINEKNIFYSPLSLNLILDKKIYNENEEIIILFQKVLSIKGLDNDQKDLIKLKRGLFFLEKNDVLNFVSELESIYNSSHTILLR